MGRSCSKDTCLYCWHLIAFNRSVLSNSDPKARSHEPATVVRLSILHMKFHEDEGIETQEGKLEPKDHYISIYLSYSERKEQQCPQRAIKSRIGPTCAILGYYFVNTCLNQKRLFHVDRTPLYTLANIQATHRLLHSMTAVVCRLFERVHSRAMDFDVYRLAYVKNLAATRMMKILDKM